MIMYQKEWLCFFKVIGGEVNEKFEVKKSDFINIRGAKIQNIRHFNKYTTQFTLPKVMFSKKNVFHSR